MITNRLSKHTVDSNISRNVQVYTVYIRMCACVRTRVCTCNLYKSSSRARVNTISFRSLTSTRKFTRIFTYNARARCSRTSTYPNRDRSYDHFYFSLPPPFMLYALSTTCLVIMRYVQSLLRSLLPNPMRFPRAATRTDSIIYIYI